jgi:glycosyltransferase involved in cell wall biosynthesis
MCYAFWLKLLKKKKFALVLTPHGGFNPEWSIFPKFTAYIKKFYHFTIGTFMINRSVDAMRAVSDWENREIIKKGVNPARVITISNGVEDEAYLDIEHEASEEIKKQVKQYGKYIIQIGRIYKIKNYETTIRALTQVPSDIHYVIAGPVGDYKYESYLKSLIAELGLEDRVFFAGVVRGVDKYYLIKKAQMMVHMAIWESFCNVVHEGLSQGLVCIVANNTALPFLIKNGVNGYTVETYDTDGVANRINHVLDNMNTPEIKTIQETNREMGLQMSWRMVAGKMDALYTELSKNREHHEFSLKLA